MDKIKIYLITLLFVFLINGNASELVPIDLASFDNSSFVEESYNIKANTNSGPELNQNKLAVPESLNMLILGASLIGLWLFIRKKRSHR